MTDVYLEASLCDGCLSRSDFRFPVMDDAVLFRPPVTVGRNLTVCFMPGGRCCPEFGARATEYVLWRRLVIRICSMGRPTSEFSLHNAECRTQNLMTSSCHGLFFSLGASSVY